MQRLVTACFLSVLLATLLIPAYGGPAARADSLTYLVAAFDAAPSTRAIATYLADGTGDDIEIQAAINAVQNLSASTKGRVVLSEGHFSTAASVTISKSNVVLSGQGGWSWISDGTTKWTHAANSAAIIFDPGDQNYRIGGVIVEKINFSGGGKQSGLSNNSAIWARRNLNGSIFRELTASSFGGDAYKLYQDLPGAGGASLFVNRFERTWAENNGGAGYRIDPTGVVGGHAEEPTFFDIYAAGNQTAGILLVNTPRAYILGSRINDNDGHGIRAINSRYLSITNTEVRYWGGAYWNPPPGKIYDGLLLEQAYESIIANNRFFSGGPYINTRYGVNIVGGDRVLVGGNVFSNEGTTPGWITPIYVTPGQNLNGRIEGNIQ